jgi:cysteinyl-tRNA synthetase
MVSLNRAFLRISSKTEKNRLINIIDHIIKMIEDLRDIFYKYEIYDYVVFDAHLKYGM